MVVHLVRHADAGPAPDEERPLTEAGRRRAESIADHLAAAGVSRILTSRYTRCLETIAPLADRLGLTAEHHDALGEEADVDAAWTLLEGLAGSGAVVCSHGNLIGPLLDRVLRGGAEIHAEEWSCPKGSVWRLEPDADRPFARATLSLP